MSQKEAGERRKTFVSGENRFILEIRELQIFICAYLFLVGENPNQEGSTPYLLRRIILFNYIDEKVLDV